MLVGCSCSYMYSNLSCHTPFTDGWQILLGLPGICAGCGGECSPHSSVDSFADMDNSSISKESIPSFSHDCFCYWIHCWFLHTNQWYSMVVSSSSGKCTTFVFSVPGLSSFHLTNFHCSLFHFAGTAGFLISIPPTTASLPLQFSSSLIFRVNVWEMVAQRWSATLPLGSLCLAILISKILTLIRILWWVLHASCTYARCSLGGENEIPS